MRQTKERAENTGKSRSFIRVFTKRFILVAVVGLAVFAVISVLFMKKKLDDYSKQILQMIDTYNEQEKKGLSRDVYYLDQLCRSDQSILSLLSVNDDVDRYQAILKSKSTMDNYFGISSTADGAFVYAPISGVLVGSYSKLDDIYFNQSCQSQGKRGIEYLLEEQKLGNRRTFSTKWSLEKVGESLVFFRYLKAGAIYAGLWRSAAITNLPVVGSPQADILYLDKEGRNIADSEDTILYPLTDMRCSLPMYWKDGSLYTIFCGKISFCDCYIGVQIRVSSILSSMVPSIVVLLASLVLISVMFFATMRLIKQTLQIPASSLELLTKQIQKNEFEGNIVYQGNYSEIRDVADSLNQLISEVQGLRISVYEEQLAVRDMELKYLKTQISPHFLINCLNVLQVASNTGNTALADTLVRTLSTHIRYTLADVQMVMLQEELDYLRNFYELIQCKYPGSFEYEIDVPAEVENTMIYPYMLLTLSENSVKAGLVMGEHYEIIVKAKCIVRNGRSFVHIVHDDSGPGISDEKLQEFANILENPERIRHGSGVGLYNEVVRMKIIFGGEGTIQFCRTPSGDGLRVELTYPIDHRGGKR